MCLFYMHEVVSSLRMRCACLYTCDDPGPFESIYSVLTCLRVYIESIMSRSLNELQDHKIFKPSLKSIKPCWNNNPLGVSHFVLYFGDS